MCCYVRSARWWFSQTVTISDTLQLSASIDFRTCKNIFCFFLRKDIDHLSCFYTRVTFKRIKRSRNIALRVYWPSKVVQLRRWSTPFSAVNYKGNCGLTYHVLYVCYLRTRLGLVYCVTFLRASFGNSLFYFATPARQVIIYLNVAGALALTVNLHTKNLIKFKQRKDKGKVCLWVNGFDWTTDVIQTQVETKAISSTKQ